MALSFNEYFNTNFSKVSETSIGAVLELSADGATIPFIARYRKEKTGNLDEVAIRDIILGKEKYDEVIKRQAFMIKEIESQGNLTAELKTRIQNSYDLGELDEIYRPYKKKKKTKATIAREGGLEPLADWIWQLGHGEVEDQTTLEVKAKGFVNAAAKFVTYDHCLQGAQNILVEKISNDEELRKIVRDDLEKNGLIISKPGKKYKKNSKFETYSDYKEQLKKLESPKTSHRYLAIRRGWQESELTVVIEGSTEVLEKAFTSFAVTKPDCQATDFLTRTAKQALSVHVMPSIVNEFHRKLKDLADTHAIQVFAENVRQLLMASPFGARCVLGVDPGLRTGSKVALIDQGGQFISDTNFRLHEEEGVKKATELLKELLSKVNLDAIAVGNGTAGRETEAALRKIVKELKVDVPVVLVNESGASVYSASEVAREEFPDLDITVRGAISIARRLQDPLAELVKIDPKSIGVGQYQHDVSQGDLKRNLDFVVQSCVNDVGVNLNTASPYLLQHISGIGPAVAKNIVEYRSTSGLFEDRDALLKVPKFSSKTFEQAAGFLRIPDGNNALDKTGIHPERYSAVKSMAQELGKPVSEMVGGGAKDILENRTKWIELLGEFTFDDIMRELESPGRDPRDPYKVFSFREDIHEMKDLEKDMICPGIVTNVTNFGAFVDIGVHQDGLVHISELTHQFVDDPKKVVKPGDQVKVKVLTIDAEKNQIALSMKLEAPPQVKTKRSPRRESKGGVKKSTSGKRTGKGNKNKGSHRAPNKARRPKPAFNNPFGALADLKSDLKK